MGMSDKKTSTTQNSTTTTTPNVPQWGVDSLKNLNTSINGIANTDPMSFVAPASTLQTQAFGGAGNLGSWQGTSQAAENLATQTANTNPAYLPQAAQVMEKGLSQYLNPYTDQVVNTTLNDFDTNAAQTRAQQAGQGAAAGAFGGSRWGLQEGETEGQLARARASTDANLRSSGYDKATALASQDAQLREQTRLANLQAQNDQLNRQSSIASLLGSLSGQSAANSRADVQTQADLGGTQQAIDQSQRTAPIAQAQTVASLLGMNQLPLLTGQTATGQSTGTATTSDPLGGLGALLGGVGGLLGTGGLASFFKPAAAKT